MRIPLIELEDYIDPAILKRGRSYFNKGKVEQCQESEPGVYETVVAGTEDYTVNLTLADGIVTEHICDCPYDMGPVCKHVVAVIYYLKQGASEKKKPVRKSNTSAKKPGRKTFAERIDSLLERISHDELKQFIREKAEYDRSLRETFLSSFAHRGEGESKAFYVSQIKSILRSAKRGRGFIDWREAQGVGSEVAQLLDVAQKHLKTQNYTGAINICTAVMETMTDALQYADDSNGDIGGNANYACEMLYEMAGFALLEDVRSGFFDYCLKAFDKKVYEGWDWHLHMLELASELARTEQEIQELFKRLEKPFQDEYKRETIERITYETLKRIHGERSAEKYLAGHLSNHYLRRSAIENALANKQYEKARMLANDGIVQDSTNKPGLVTEWYDWLLKIAQAEKDTDGVIGYARLLFLDSHHDTREYYSILKKHVNKNEWQNFVEGLIDDLGKKDRWSSVHRIANIYIDETMWDRLFDLVKESPSIYNLETYEKYLKKDYADELANMYAIAVVEYLDQNVGRKHYQKACRYLRRIKKLGSPQTAETAIETLRAKYSQRPALLEELEVV